MVNSSEPHFVVCLILIVALKSAFCDIVCEGSYLLTLFMY
jgi:hypothetical protein